MRALIVTNMYPSTEHPALGSFVRDQVEALRALGGVNVEVEAFSAGGAGSYARAAARLRRRYRHQRFDIVHAHFGLSAWPALGVPARFRLVTLHGTDLTHPRSRAITLLALPWLDRVAVVSAELAGSVPAWAARGREVLVLPCGVDTERFRVIDRRQARTALGLDPDARYVLFPASPARPEKRFDRAQALVAAAGDVRLLTLGDVDPNRVPLFVNAADAVLVTSEREGFGLAALEALACDVAVLSTPHGVAPEALAGVAGTYCGPFDVQRWGKALAGVLAQADPRIEGRAAAQGYSASAMAGRVLETYTRATESVRT
jgi:glycosyltransferase involved in cell wall biosynthesis